MRNITEEELNYIEIKGGFRVPRNDTCIGVWQVECQNLVHDMHLPKLVCSHLKPGNTVIDAGALAGDHTKAYSDEVGKDGMVIAIEPGRTAFECLVHNAGLFKHRNVLALLGALGEKHDLILQHDVNENLGMSHCNKVEKEVNGGIYLLSATIDQIAEQSGRKIDFIKLDIEGWEVHAMIGGSKTLAKDHPGLLIEVNQEALRLQGSTEEEIYEILDYHKYNWQITQPQSSIGDPVYDILCFPKE